MVVMHLARTEQHQRCNTSLGEDAPQINVKIHRWFVFENVLARLNSLKLMEGCMKIISGSKRGHKPIICIFQNELAVAMDLIEEILPIFLKRSGQEKQFRIGNILSSNEERRPCSIAC
jgi:hypothetical protein